MPPTYRPHGARDRMEVRRAADERRGSARERGYDARWERARTAYIAAHPLCIGCEAVGRVTRASVVDHIVPHQGDQRLFWDEANWQPCCSFHHDRVKQQLEARWRAAEIGVAALRLGSSEAAALTRMLDG
jgi:5-methylcytosine-specific restriction endonuclease McrA